MTAVLMLALALAVPASAASPGPRVRAWEGQLELPTYEEGAPDVNPPFDVFETRRYNYPYTLRENLTDHRSPARWRTLELENEYLQLHGAPRPRRPSLQLRRQGERRARCSTRTPRSRRHASPTAARGPRWASSSTSPSRTTGPPSRRWTTRSPRSEDGSASVWVGNVDRVYGMQWRVALTLRPGSSALEQDVALYNRERRAAPLLLVEQRRSTGLGRQPHRVPHALHRLARVHARSTPGP